jgi:hypothetical protein
MTWTGDRTGEDMIMTGDITGTTKAGTEATETVTGRTMMAAEADRS